MRRSVVTIAILGFVFLGCSSINRLDSKVEKVTTNTPDGSMVHEGKVKVARPIGSMTSIQFENGTVFDVREAPPALRPGDLVRIYKDEEGIYDARLWKATDDSKVALPVSAPPATSPAPAR